MLGHVLELQLTTSRLAGRRSRPRAGHVRRHPGAHGQACAGLQPVVETAADVQVTERRGIEVDLVAHHHSVRDQLPRAPALRARRAGFHRLGTLRTQERAGDTAMKLCAWRDDVDVDDARLLLSKLAGDREAVWVMVEPHLVPGRELKSRYAFDDVWEERLGPA